MKKSKPAPKADYADVQKSNPLRLRTGKESSEAESQVHVLNEEKGFVCDTERRGFPTPEGRSLTEIVVDASEGFIPLWAKDTVLRWRFQERSFLHFVNPEAAKAAVRDLFGQALVKWGSAAPVKFSEKTDVWDFEIVVKSADSCSINGCTLAKAFFPDAGRHELILFPKLFTQDPKEQVDTLIHEIGHIFGLRHFFAQLREVFAPSQIFGKHNEFSIMNYGVLSELTADDQNDLTRLYQLAWAGKLTHINGTPIKFVQAFHTQAPQVSSAFAVAEIQRHAPSQPMAAYVQFNG
jgi:hypothetical protein